MYERPLPPPELMSITVSRTAPRGSPIERILSAPGLVGALAGPEITTESVGGLGRIRGGRLKGIVAAQDIEEACWQTSHRRHFPRIATRKCTEGEIVSALEQSGGGYGSMADIRA